MAQLPPKAPSMTHYYHHYHNWPSSSSSSSTTTTTSSSSSSSFHHQKLLPSMSNFHLPNHITNINQLQPSWVDDFLDFSSTRRVAHRRSVSADSFAFLLDDCSNSINHNNNINSDDMAAEANCFERLDDDQLMSLFSDDVSMTLHPPTASSSNPSTPSDQNSNNDDKPTTLDQQQPKNEPGEVESSCKFEAQLPTQTTTTTTTTSNADQLFDPKRVKRILANRQSAQGSRVRKLQYISELERSVTTLQTEVSALSPRVAFLDHQRLILNVDNSAIKQRIAALAQDKIFKDAHQEALKKEIGRLRQVYHQQSLNKINTTAATAAAASNTNDSNAAAAPPQPMSTDTNNMVCTDKEQQLLNREDMSGPEVH